MHVGGKNPDTKRSWLIHGKISACNEAPLRHKSIPQRGIMVTPTATAPCEQVHLKATVFGPRGAGKTSIVSRIGGVEPRASATAAHSVTYAHSEFTRSRVRVGTTLIVFTAWDLTDFNVQRYIPYGETGSYFLREHSYMRRDSAVRRQSDVAVLVFDASSTASLRECVVWIKENDGGIRECVKALVANKVDVASPVLRATLAEARDVADKYGWHFFETSAKSGTGISEMVDALASAALKMLKSRMLKSNMNKHNDGDGEGEPRLAPVRSDVSRRRRGLRRFCIIS